MDKISGVYKITNKITGDFYIGSSNNIKKRWYSHKCHSTWKRQPSSKLYRDMTQYGLDNFLFEIIEETNNIHEREQYWIDKLKPSYNSNRADGWDIERRKETSRRCCKAWHKAHRDEHLAKNKVYQNRLCFYEGETLTLHALMNRFYRQGIIYPTLEAKKYLI